MTLKVLHRWKSGDALGVFRNLKLSIDVEDTGIFTAECEDLQLRFSGRKRAPLTQRLEKAVQSLTCDNCRRVYRIKIRFAPGRLDEPPALENFTSRLVMDGSGRLSYGQGGFVDEYNDGKHITLTIPDPGYKAKRGKYLVSPIHRRLCDELRLLFAEFFQKQVRPLFESYRKHAAKPRPRPRRLRRNAIAPEVEEQVP